MPKNTELVQQYTQPESALIADKKAEALFIDWEAIPSELTRLNFLSWLNWQPKLKHSEIETIKLLEKNDSAKIFSKPPVGDPKTYKSFELAKAYVLRSKGTYGIAIAYTAEHPYICIDVDDGGEIAEDIIADCNSYTEWGPSLNGVHIIVQVESIKDKKTLSALFGGKAASKKLELFIASGNYVTVTGRRLSNKGIRCFDPHTLRTILEKYFEPRSNVIQFPTDSLKTSPLARVAQAPEISDAVMKRITVMLDAIHPATLYENVFTDLLNGEPAILDPECTEGARSPWLTIAQALHSYFKGSLIGFKLFADWSARDPEKFDMDACEAVWRSFKDTDSGVTIASLYALYNAQKPQYEFVNAKRVPLPVIQNILSYYKFYRYKFQYDEMTGTISVEVPDKILKVLGFKAKHVATLDTALPIIKSELLLQGFAQSNMPDSLLFAPAVQLALQNSKHAIRDYFNQLSWDGKSRLQELCNTIQTQNGTVANNEAYMLYMRKWLIQVIAAAYSTAEKPNTLSAVLVFVGDTGIGKSKWVQALFPKSLRQYCAASRQISFDRYKTTDQEFELSNLIIANIDEIDIIFQPRHASALKSFLSTTTSVRRLPYGKIPVTLVRRTVFIGSTNERSFLVDMTGNRRVFIIPSTSLDYEHTIDIDQLWAEVKTYYNQGEKWWLDKENTAEAPIIDFQKQQNLKHLYVPMPAFEDFLNDMYDTTAPVEQWRMTNFKRICDLAGSTIGNVTVNSLAYKDAKKTLVIWLQQFPDHYVYEPKKNDKHNSKRYLMPPLKSYDNMEVM